VLPGLERGGQQTPGRLKERVLDIAPQEVHSPATTFDHGWMPLVYWQLLEHAKGPPTPVDGSAGAMVELVGSNPRFGPRWAKLDLDQNLHPPARTSNEMLLRELNQGQPDSLGVKR